MQIGVVGSSVCDERLYRIAYRVGELIAEKGCILINGGLGGVMEASAKGAKSKGGLVVGILPYGKDICNEYVDIKIATHMGHARNVIIVHSSDAIIAVGGEYGTISEIAIALKEKKKVAAIEPPIILKGMKICKTAEDAVEYVTKDF